MNADERIDVLRACSREKGLRVFVETGTADGYTTFELRHDFDRLITIELDYERYLHVATTLFLPSPHILPLWGDSGKVLEEVIYYLEQPSLFWLDAHFCGGARGEVDTPILVEFRLIVEHAKNGSVALIDDVDLFGTDPAYPTLQHLKEWAEDRGHRLNWDTDLIRLDVVR